MEETFEEAAEKYAIENWGNEIMFQNNKKHYIKIFTDGVKWQQERSRKEEEIEWKKERSYDINCS